MAFITFNYNKNLIYAIIFWGLEIVFRGCVYFKYNNFRIATNCAINEYIYAILLNISDLFAGFLALYIHVSSKKKKILNRNQSDLDSNISKITTSIDFISVKDKYFTQKSFIVKMIFLICLNYFVSLTGFIFFAIVKKARDENIYQKARADIVTHVDIITRYIFSYVLLETKIFKHHKFSIIIILIAFVILVPTDAISMHFYRKEPISELYTYMYIGFFLVSGTLYPLGDTFVKKVFTEDYIIPEFYMFIRGIGELILILIITPILYFTFNGGNKIEFNPNVGDITWVVILYTISSFIKEYLIMKVIYYFSSQSVSFLIISESITASICEIILYFNSEGKAIKSVFFVIQIIVIFITTFGTLVFDEIIVIKKWDLDLNVAAEISLRARSEIISISNFDDDTIEDNDEDGDEDKDNIDESKLDLIPSSVVE